MKLYFSIGLLILFISPPVPATDRSHPLPDKGILDLRGFSLENHTVIGLNGEWEFFWNRLVTPETLAEEEEKSPGMMVEVPSYFSDYSIDGTSLPGRGFGTYALTILLPDEQQSAICFDIPIFDVAYRFYLDDRLIESNGKIGTSMDEEEPWYEPSSFCLVPSGDTMQLLIQVSNFHHRRGGFWKSLMIGGADGILDRLERKRIYNYSTIGILFFFTFFFIIFWLFSRKQALMLLFSLTTLGILVRSVNTGLYFSNHFILAPWSWQIRMEYLGTFMAHIFGMLFLHRVFPAGYMKWPIRVNTLLFSLAILSLFILPVRYFSYEMLLFQPLLLAFMLYYLVRGLTGMIRKRITDTVFFISLAFFIYSLVNDILLANTAGAIHNSYLSQIAFELFIFAMSALIIMQWVGNYNERLKLESSLRFKNKVLSVVAHDLKNPVASVAQFSDLLATKPELTGKPQVIRSLRDSAQAAVTMLENLLFWGTTQSDELKAIPGRVDLQKLAGEAEALFRHMALQKKLKVTWEVLPGTLAYADPVLVNIMIRNLVSNAIKFTPEGGRVHVDARREGEQVRISVRDSGQGIKPEDLKRFTEEGRLDSTAGTHNETGTGLGLQLVSDLVQRCGGELSIESEPGKGSNFEFTLPAFNE